MRASLISAKRTAFVAAATLLALTLPSSASAGEDAAVDAAAAGKITVEVKAINGSGCPAGTASVDPAADDTGFEVKYDRFAARSGPGSAPTDRRRNCQLGVQVHVPQGFTFAIARADYHGYVYLGSGATALARTNYYFQGDQDNTFVDHSFAGARYGAWHATHVTPVAELVYAPCGRDYILNVNSELRVNPGHSDPRRTNLLAMRTTDARVNTIFNFAWKRC
jgi:hypothetical protein